MNRHFDKLDKSRLDTSLAEKIIIGMKTIRDSQKLNHEQLEVNEKVILEIQRQELDIQSQLYEMEK
jgi:hypothetical protein